MCGCVFVRVRRKQTVFVSVANYSVVPDGGVAVKSSDPKAVLPGLLFNALCFSDVPSTVTVVLDMAPGATVRGGWVVCTLTRVEMWLLTLFMRVGG
jgi:hypothetical protein